VVLKMGTKEVLHRSRAMSWGCDTALYRTAEAMRAELPMRLAAGPRVIKRNRGNGGQGVWMVERLASPCSRTAVRVLDATKDVSEELALNDFLERCTEYFEDACVIDQPFQARLREGVVRCYMAGDVRGVCAPVCTWRGVRTGGCTHERARDSAVQRGCPVLADIWRQGTSDRGA
jgi:hypothetical protein